MKKIVLLISLIVLVLALSIGIYFGIFYDRPEIIFEEQMVLKANIEDTIEKKVSETIITSCIDKYNEGYQAAEAHIILATQENETETLVYALAQYGRYDIEDNRYERIVGSEITPVVIKLSQDQEGNVLSSISWITKDKNYEKKIKQIFPADCYQRVINISEDDKDKMDNMEYQYARDQVIKGFLEKPIEEQKDFLQKLLESNKFINNSGFVKEDTFGIHVVD